MAIVLSGIVSMFNDIHGSGIIEHGNGSEKIKFSYKDIVQQGFRLPNEGQYVDFEIVNTINGPKARNIVLKDDK
jgi:cold shock CspA family protein